jgi:phage FluMu protein gp41
MSVIDVTLQDGIQIGETLHHKIQLRELTIGEQLQVNADSERVVATPSGYALVPSPSLLTFLTLLRQIVLVNDPGVFVTEAQLKKASARDFDALIVASSQLEKATLEAAETRGRSHGPTAAS